LALRFLRVPLALLRCLLPRLRVQLFRARAVSRSG